jgi:catechol 2,3-dioxygenase-like lactoylglutathione lyase family enzyme
MIKPVQFLSLLSLLLAPTQASLFSASDPEPLNEVGIQYLGHVGVAVSDLEKALHFYTHQLGLKEAFRLLNSEGAVALVYLRVNGNNFVELFPGAMKQSSSQSNQTGIRHLGLFVKDLQTTLRTLKSRGFPLPDDAFEKASKVQADGTFLYFIKDPDGNSIELSQILPDSFQAKSRRGLKSVGRF